jgi:formylglycine-generating enzyme
VIALALLACGLGDGDGLTFEQNPGKVDTGPDSQTLDSDTLASDTQTEPTQDTGSDTSGPCLRGMAWIDETFCMDRYEAALEEQIGADWVASSPYETVAGRTVRAVSQLGLVPQGYISGDQAAAACAASGKRLCTDSEWNLACVGPVNTTWPYGDTHVDGACNDDYVGTHPVIDYFGTSDGIWDSDSMNDPGINQQVGTLAAGGVYGDCRSHWGVHDLHGNLHEWVDESSGVFRGGFYGDGSYNGNGCTYVTTAHSRSYHDYSTGFRCCQDP